MGGVAWKAFVVTMVLGIVASGFAEARAQLRNEEEFISTMLEAYPYPATGNVVGLIFYYQFTVQVTGAKRFEGMAGGLGSPGGGALVGTVYTDDITKLYQNTVSFQFISTPVYLSLIFFDASSNSLGTFQSGGISTVLGTGGGSGSWKN